MISPDMIAWSKRNTRHTYMRFCCASFCCCYNIHFSLQWRHHDRDCVSNHWRLDCLLNRWFKRRWEKTSKPCVTGLCERNPSVTGGFPHKRPVTRKKFPFDVVIKSTSNKSQENMRQNAHLVRTVHIAWTLPLRHVAAEPHSPLHLQRMLDWSLSGHYRIAPITPQGTSKV